MTSCHPYLLMRAVAWAHVIEMSKELNFYRACLNGFCVSSHMVDSFFTEHVAVMSPLWLDVPWHRSEYMQGEHARLWPGHGLLDVQCSSSDSPSAASAVGLIFVPNANVELMFCVAESRASR